MDAITPVTQAVGSDETAATYDEPYQFGRRPTARAPFPFTERQFARLLITRGRLRALTTSPDQLVA